MNKKIFLIFSLIILFITTILYFRYLNLPVDKNASSEVYEVVSLATPSEVFDELESSNIIKSSKKAQKLFSNKQYQLTANVYSISKSNTLEEIVDILGSKESNVDSQQACKVVITEGMEYKNILKDLDSCFSYTYENIDEHFKSQTTLDNAIDDYWFLDESIKDDKIINPLEGYFAPATYYFTKDATLDEISSKFLDTTEKNLKEYKNDPLLKKYSIHQIMTMASLVEREALHEEDRYKIAGVFFNRLEQDMYLQSDITVLYALDSKKELVTYKDLEVDSYYNTYKYGGLMPGPIASPSISSIDAVFNSSDNDYLYFFANQDTGEVYYSKTLEEHEEISKKYAWE